MLKEILEKIVESKCDVNKVKKAFDGKTKESQRAKMAVLDMARADYDDSFGAEYYYGSYKDRSQSDSDFLTQFMIDNDIPRCSTDDMAQVIVGSKDLKKYFKNMR